MNRQESLKKQKAEASECLQDSDWDWFVLQEVDETSWHFQLVDAVDLVDLSEVSSDGESALRCQGHWVSWRRQRRTLSVRDCP